MAGQLKLTCRKHVLPKMADGTAASRKMNRSPNILSLQRRSGLLKVTCNNDRQQRGSLLTTATSRRHQARCSLGYIASLHQQHRKTPPSLPARTVRCAASSAATSSGKSGDDEQHSAYDMRATWLLGLMKQPVIEQGQALPWLAAWLTLFCNQVVMAVVMAFIPFTLFNQDKLAAALGGGTTSVLFFLMFGVLSLAGGSAGAVYHDYENWSIADHKLEPEVDRSKSSSGWLLMVCVRALATYLTFALLSFTAAVYGINTPIVVLTAVCVLLSLGPYRPLLVPTFNGRPTLFMPAVTLASVQLAQFAYIAALWKLFGPVGLALLIPLTVSFACEVAVQSTLNQWVHAVGHACALVFFAAKLLLMARLIGWSL